MMSAPPERTPQNYNALSLSVEESGHPIVKPIIFEFDVLQLQIFHKDKFDEHVLHHGKSSELLRGQMKDGTEVVIKKRPVSEISSSRSEAKILREIKHCGIVGYICFHEDDEFTYLVLDLVESTLEEHIEQINSLLTDEDEKKAKLKELTVKVLQALNFLHQEQYIHGDVKLRNVRVDKVKPKLIDFTLSEKMTDRNVQKMKDEIHKAGVLAYYILSGGENYRGLNTEFAVSKLEWDFIKGMTEKKQSLKKALDHPVFWKDYRKLKYLEALGNLNLQDTKKLREKTSFNIYENWRSKISQKLPDFNLLMKMEQERTNRETRGAAEGEVRPYPDNLFGLLRFIRNLLQHRPEEETDFLFQVFPDLFQRVYIIARDMEWNSKPSVNKILSAW